MTLPFNALGLAAETPADANRNAIALEALSRLKGMDLEANPAIKTAVMRVLESVKGTPHFVELVRDFKIKGQAPALFDVALKNATNATGVDAVRLILDEEGLGPLNTALNGPDVEVAAKTAQLLGHAGDKQVVPLLESVVADVARDARLRKEATLALAKTEEGAGALLNLAKRDKLPADVKLLAAAELNRARWPEIKAQAAEILPLPQTRNQEPLPPVAELVTQKGDARRGEQVFSSPTVACINCHQVNGKGIDFGPSLSEIGSKLGKDALYEAILNPNSGISFGYEAWEITLKNGDEAFGLIASETADELALKAQTGIVTRYRKADIARRQQMKTSVMPTGLEQAMTVQELVDLVEYLTSLKKPHPGNQSP